MLRCVLIKKPDTFNCILKQVIHRFLYFLFKELSSFQLFHFEIYNREASRCDESSCLRMLLDKRDAWLGPWTPGRCNICTHPISCELVCCAVYELYPFLIVICLIICYFFLNLLVSIEYGNSEIGLKMNFVRFKGVEMVCWHVFGKMSLLVFPR